MVDGLACEGRHPLPRPCHRDVIDGSGGAAVARILRRIDSHTSRPTHPRYRRSPRSQDSSATNANGPPRARSWGARTAEGRVSHGGRLSGMTSYCQCNTGESKVSKVASAASTSKQKELQDHGVMLGGDLPPTQRVIRNRGGTLEASQYVRRLGPPKVRALMQHRCITRRMTCVLPY